MNVALAVLRVAAALTLYAAGVVDVDVIRPMPLRVYAALAATFSVIALGLVLGHQKDRRAAWLGGILALVASPFSVPLLANGPLAWVIGIRPDAFLGAFVWEFVACFPTDLQGRRAKAFRGIVAAGVCVGVYLAVTSLLGLWLARADAGAARGFPLQLVSSVSSNPTVFYWPLLLGVAVPAFFALLWRAWVAEGAAARQVRVFVAGLLIGLGPIALEVFVEGVWRSYENFVHSPAVEPWVGAVMFAALASLPLTTAYSVLFDRVVSVRLVLQKALQYALARYIVLALTLIPFGGLILFLAQHRDEPLTNLLSGARRPVVLGGLGLVGVLALKQRPRLLGALDRRYFREPFDAGRILERLMARSAPDLGDLGARICDEVGRAFHARVYVLLADETRTVLRDTGERLQPLSAMTPLVTAADRDAVLDVGAPAAHAWRERLPAHERAWLAGANISVIAPIRSHELGPIGLIALTPRLSELPYTSEDRSFLATVASAAGLAFDRFHYRAPNVAVSPEPAGRECERCFSVYASEAKHCLCGGTLVEAPVPHVLRGVFRLEQRIAAGSMGVVYRAVDLGLGRTVAIKTLPRVADDRRAALVQEARAMARVTHANLAVVHGVETWRGVSFLVQEYLERGTLARRLFAARLPAAEAIDLGRLLADLLEHLHRDNLIHCDIKPSNIGYTSDDVVKLFDFGLAQHLEGRETSPSTETMTFVGTPAYMSPEAIRGEPPSPVFDLWALSVVLYEAIAGRRPFDGTTTPDVLAAILRGDPPRLKEVAPGTPDAVTEFFERALHRDRGRRPASAGELGRALGDVRGALGPTSRLSAARAGAYEVQT